MKITVLGATGGTGRQLIDQALEASHEVTAVVRDPAKLPVHHPRLTVVRADVLDASALTPHVIGRDAVLSALGGSGLGPTTVQSEATAAVIEAMREVGVRRLIVVSNSGMVEGDNEGVFTKYLVNPILRRVLREPWADMARMEAIVHGGDLDWTVVRPPMLTDGPRTETYRRVLGDSSRAGIRVSRANLADCMLRCLADSGMVRETVTIGN